MFLTNDIDLSKYVEFSDESLKQLMEQKEQFGIRAIVWDGELKSYLISPSHHLKEKHIQNIKINTPERSFNHYECLMSNISFKPLYGSLRGVYDRILNYIINKLDKEEYFELNFTFKFNRKWNIKSVDLLESYLEGNDHPSSIGFVRRLQERTIKVLDRISSFGEERKVYPEYEEKILSPVYSFIGSIKTDASNSEELIEWMNKQLSVLDFHNCIRFETCREESREYNSNNILSVNEILSLFSNEKASVKEKPVTISEESFLPQSITLDVEIDPQLEKDIAQALKQVKLINQAKIEVVDHKKGIRLTTLEMKIPKATSFSQIEKKVKDIQAIIGVQSLSVEQGSKAGTIRMMIPNSESQMLLLSELVNQDSFKVYAANNPLAFPVGYDESNNPLYASLRSLVNLLVAGSAGSGKSVFLNSLALSLLMNYSPDELCMFMIDPKMVELQQFEQFPHVAKVITEMDKANAVLKSLVVEMDRRYELFKEANVKNIDGYNKKGHRLESVVILIDEYADLVMVEPDVEEHITRLGQKARAAGIHTVLATQRPSADILSSKIQANFQNAISFNLGNNINYKTVFGSGIPFQLMGKGDGVARFEGYDKEFQRFQGCKIASTDEEEEDIYEKVAKLYDKETDFDLEVVEKKSQLDQLKELIANTGETRVSALQKELKIRMDTVQSLMSELVEEGWLIKHKARSKGYELIASENELEKFKMD